MVRFLIGRVEIGMQQFRNLLHYKVKSMHAAAGWKAETSASKLVNPNTSTMKKILWALSVVVFSTVQLWSQQNQVVELIAVGDTVSVGDSLHVKVYISNLDDVVGLDFGFKFDTNTLRYLGHRVEDSDFSSMSAFKPFDSDTIRVQWNTATDKGVTKIPRTHLMSLYFTALRSTSRADTVYIVPSNTTKTEIEIVQDNGAGADVLLPYTLTHAVYLVEGAGGGGNSDTTIIVHIGSAIGAPNEEVCIDFTVDNFDNVASFIMPVRWDTKVARFSRIIDAHPSLGTFEPTKQYNYVDSTFLNVSWQPNSPDGVSLPDGSTIFKACFHLTGNPGNTTQVTSETFDHKLNTYYLEFTDPNGIEIPARTIPGSLTIQLDTTEIDTFLVAFESRDARPGEQVCVPVRFYHYQDVESFQFAIQWDPAVLSNPRLKNFNVQYIPDSSGTVFSEEVFDGALSLLALLVDPLNAPDGTRLFDVCFDVVGNCGDSTLIYIQDDTLYHPDTVDIFYLNRVYTGVLTDEDPRNLYLPGKVRVACDTGGDDRLTVFIQDYQVNKGERICVPVQVNNFKDIETAQFVIKYDTNVLEIDRDNPIEDFILPQGLDPFRVDSKTKFLFFSWSHPSSEGVTLQDSTALFKVCFYAKGDCDDMSPIRIDTSGTIKKIEFNDSNFNTVPYRLEHGKVTIVCPGGGGIKVTATRIHPPRCHGDNNGLIVIDVQPPGSYRYQWYRNGEPIPASEGGTNQTLSNVSAGTYFVVVENIATGEKDTFGNFVIQDPPPLTKSWMITPDTTGNCTGRIVAQVDGGYGKYSIRWLVSGTQGPVVENVCACTYEVLNVRDSVPQYVFNGSDYDTVYQGIYCFKGNDTIFVPGQEIQITSSEVRDETCPGSCDGRIQISAEGGCGTLKAVWNGPRVNNVEGFTLENLCPGTYVVHLMDTTNVVYTDTFVVRGPSPIEITIMAIDTTCPGKRDGAIYIKVTGGTPDYTYEWQNEDGQVVSNNKDLIGVGPGYYTLKVTDSKGCTVDSTILLPLLECGGGGDMLEVMVTTSEYNGNYNISCAGAKDGWIAVHIKGANPADYTVMWSHDDNLRDTIATNLPAGTYTVTVKDKDGNIVFEEVVILTEPPVLEASIQVDSCATASGALDAIYRVNVQGGTPPYTYLWCNDARDEVVDNLPGGVNCNVIVTDANGCEVIVNFKVCIRGDNPTECFTARPVITPNDDGLNDFLLITCDAQYDNVLRIYDRWGRLVWEKVNYRSELQEGWHGVDFNNNPLPEGGYLWVFKVILPSGVERYYKGTVIIER